MITGCIPTEDREYCQMFIQKKYGNIDGHATPLKGRIILEAYTRDGMKFHNLKRHENEFVEIELPMNDR